MSHTCKGNRWLRTALIEARRVLEPEWSALSVVEREEFIRLFGDRLLWGYLSIVRGKLPRDQPPTIRLVGEEVGAGGRVALVRTMIRAKDGADVRFDYVMTKAAVPALGAFQFPGREATDANVKRVHVGRRVVACELNL